MLILVPELMTAELNAPPHSTVTESDAERPPAPAYSPIQQSSPSQSKEETPDQNGEVRFERDENQSGLEADEEPPPIRHN